ncbi:subunit of the Arp2/3 complex [Thoreauomyces humboldtii]|nr:subunit of the Arp2/3 complex [Thoreauomyces humboldtii]
MPAYHSSFNEPAGPNQRYRSLGNIALLPIKTKIKGPAPSADSSQDDIIDEAIALFRANCFFRNFEIKGNADRALIYLLLFIQECLGKLQKGTPSPTEGQRTLVTHALQNFSIPGEPQFPLNAMYEKTTSKNDADALRQYLSQLRQECATRLAVKVYNGEDKPSKWWMCFSKRKFMGLPNIGTLQ